MLEIYEKKYQELKDTNPIYKYVFIDAVNNLENKFENSLYYQKVLNTWVVFYENRNEALENELSYYLIGINDTTLEKNVINLLHKGNLKFSAAESCTGGLIISRLISVSGASYVIEESYITYSNNAKNKILGVKKDTINKYSVTSIEVAKEMAEGLANITKSNICVSVTGFTSSTLPTDTDGLFFFGIKVNHEEDYIHLEKEQVSGNREECRYQQVTYILWRVYNILRKIVK